MADGSILEQTPDTLRVATLEPTHKHIAALDGVRGLAILLVMAQHFTLVEHGIFIDRVLGAAGRFGWTGVDLFFLLSGFLITGILLNSRGQAHYFRNFYARRVLRIFPAYYALLIVALTIVPHLYISANDNFRTIPTSHWPIFITYLSNYAIAFTPDRLNDFLGITWSLAIEEQFYLVWPLVILFCKPKTILKVCVGLIALSLLLRTSLVITFIYFIHGEADRNKVYVLTPCRFDAISMGSIMAVVVYQRGVSAIRAAMPKLLAVCAVAIMGIMICCALHKSTGWGLGPGQTFGYTCVAAMYATLFAGILISKPGQLLNRIFTSRPLLFMGKYSYAIYLVHMPIMRYTRSYWYGPDKFWTIHGSLVPGQLLFYVICFVPSVTLGLLSWNLMEKHILKLKKYFPTHPPVEKTRLVKSSVETEELVLV